jgi:hypothetical protein
MGATEFPTGAGLRTDIPGNSLSASRRLCAAEWGSLAVATVAAGLFLRLTVWPGLMSYDSLFFWREAVDGVTLSTWPPAYAYLVKFVRALGGSYGALLLAQDLAVVWFGGYLAMTLAGAERRARLCALALWFAGFAVFPTLLGTMLVLWNMTALAALTLAGLAGQLAAWRSGRLKGALLAALAYGAGFAIRYDAVVLLAPALGVLLAWPSGRSSPWAARSRVAGVLGATFGLGLISFAYRLPDLRPLEPNAGATIIQTFDLIGGSAVCGADYLPPRMTRGGEVTPADIRAHYDPRHLNLSAEHKDHVADFGPGWGREIGPAWRRLVTQRPDCYLRHRWRVFREQMGLVAGPVFYATHVGIDPNPYGFQLRRPKAALAVEDFVLRGAASQLFRPWWLYVGAVVAAAGASARRSPGALALWVPTACAWTYALSRLVLSPAADARYIFPASVLCAVVIAAGAGPLILAVKRS